MCKNFHARVPSAGKSTKTVTFRGFDLTIDSGLFNDLFINPIGHYWQIYFRIEYCAQVDCKESLENNGFSEIVQVILHLVYIMI